MLLLNIREERIVVKGDGDHLYKNTCYLHTDKHREICHEHRENTGNLILPRTWPPCICKVKRVHMDFSIDISNTVFPSNIAPPLIIAPSLFLVLRNILSSTTSSLFKTRKFDR